MGKVQQSMTKKTANSKLSFCRLAGSERLMRGGEEPATGGGHLHPPVA